MNRSEATNLQNWFRTALGSKYEVDTFRTALGSEYEVEVISMFSDDDCRVVISRVGGSYPSVIIYDGLELEDDPRWKE